MIEHTKGTMTSGTMEVVIDGRLSLHHVVGIDNSRTAIALTGLVGGDGENTDERSAADARRLAACWNACEHMQTADIEAYGEAVAGVVGPIGKGHIALAAERDQLRADLAEARHQRDSTQAICEEAYLLLAEMEDADLATMSRSGQSIDEGAADGNLVGRIRTFLAGERKLIDPASAVREAAWHATRLADSLGQVLTVRQVPRQPLAMGNYDTVVEVREAHAVYRAREEAEEAAKEAYSVQKGAPC